MRRLGGKIGEVITYETKQQIREYGPYYRIRLKLDFTKPFKPFLLAWKEGHGEVKIDIKYERLPIYYYYCGVIGHQDHECKIKFEDKFRGEAVDKIQAQGWCMVTTSKLLHMQGMSSIDGYTNHHKTMP